TMPPSRAEQALLAEREILETALARIRYFVDAEDREWIVRYPTEPGATLELVPLAVTSMARELLRESADFVVLSSASLGHRSAPAGAGAPAHLGRVRGGQGARPRGASDFPGADGARLAVTPGRCGSAGRFPPLPGGDEGALPGPRRSMDRRPALARLAPAAERP